MENATKALLIAAAVLIVILLIAFGMRIFNSTSKTSEEAIKTGQLISNSVSIITQTLNSDLQYKNGFQVLEETPENYNNTINSFFGSRQNYSTTTNAVNTIYNMNVNYTNKIFLNLVYYDNENNSKLLSRQINTQEQLEDTLKRLNNEHTYSIEKISVKDTGYIWQVTIREIK